MSPRALAPLLGVLVAAALSPSAARSAAPAALPEARGHRDLAGERPALRPETLARRALHRALGPAPLAAAAPGPAVDREVYGYLPYWEMGYDFPHWELLTTVAWFAVSMGSDGLPDDYNGWGGAETEALVAEAQAHGVRAVVTVTSFDSGAIGTLVNDPARRATAIESILTLMAMHGADGVNVDFEFVPAAGKAGFVAFMRDLKDAVAQAAPNGHAGHVTLAGPAIDWSGAYDYDQLLLHTDGIMMMAYGYHWSGGDPGPVSPLYGGGKWGKHSVAWSIDDYLTYGGVENRHKIIVGLPWYGRSWPVASTAIPGKALGKGDAITFDAARPEAAAQGASWDDDALVPYYHKGSGASLRQVWYDDQASFGLKLAYIAEQDLGGVGIWALGYDGAWDDYWVELADQWTAGEPVEPPVEEPPVEEPPVEEPPVEEPPVEEPPVEPPPGEDPPTSGGPPAAAPAGVVASLAPAGASTRASESVPAEGCGATRGGPAGPALGLGIALLLAALRRRAAGGRAPAGRTAPQ